MTPETLLASARAMFEATPDACGLLDRCEVIRITRSAGSDGGTTPTESTLASDVPCLYEERVYRPSRVVGGQTVASATHNLFLLATSVTRAIGSDYKIVVAARDDTPELTFRGPIRLDESLGPLVTLGATLVV